MDMADTLIEQLRERVEPIAIRFHLELLALFGSAARKRLRERIKAVEKVIRDGGARDEDF